jgi:hypothetical protein
MTLPPKLGEIAYVASMTKADDFISYVLTGHDFVYVTAEFHSRHRFKSSTATDDKARMGQTV